MQYSECMLRTTYIQMGNCPFFTKFNDIEWKWSEEKRALQAVTVTVGYDSASTHDYNIPVAIKSSTNY